MIIHSKYDWADDFCEGIAAVSIEEKYGFIDKEGREIIPLKFDSVGVVSEGLIAVEMEGRWGYINNKGEFIIKLFMIEQKNL